MNGTTCLSVCVMQAAILHCSSARLLAAKDPQHPTMRWYCTRNTRIPVYPFYSSICFTQPTQPSHPAWSTHTCLYRFNMRYMLLEGPPLGLDSQAKHHARMCTHGEQPRPLNTSPPCLLALLPANSVVIQRVQACMTSKLGRCAPRTTCNTVLVYINGLLLHHLGV